jgi:hypothetical protein
VNDILHHSAFRAPDPRFRVRSQHQTLPALVPKMATSHSSTTSRRLGRMPATEFASAATVDPEPSSERRQHAFTEQEMRRQGYGDEHERIKHVRVAQTAKAVPEEQRQTQAPNQHADGMQGVDAGREGTIGHAVAPEDKVVATILKVAARRAP